MRNAARRYRALLLAIPVAAALSFGAGQALASPAAEPRGAEGSCLERACWTACPIAGGVMTHTGCMCCEY